MDVYGEGDKLSSQSYVNSAAGVPETPFHSNPVSFELS